MGMGLPISRSIIEAHGGQIRAENDSKLGGARFTFHLPAMSARKSRKKTDGVPRDGTRSIRRRLALSLHLCSLYPPHQIVGEAREGPFEGFTAFAYRRTISREGLSDGTNSDRA
jgi:hypothetical protein